MRSVARLRSESEKTIDGEFSSSYLFIDKFGRRYSKKLSLARMETILASYKSDKISL